MVKALPAVYFSWIDHSPIHSYQAEEVYVPLSRTAFWKMNEGGWPVRERLKVLHHRNWTPYAMQTEKPPWAALYLWRVGDLKQKSRIDSAAVLPS